MALRRHLCGVERRHLASRSQHRWVGTEAHGATHVRDVDLLCHQVDHRVGRQPIELGRVRTIELRHGACRFDDHDLHAEADAEEWDASLPSDAGSCDHALDASLAEAARNHDPVEPLKAIRPDLTGHLLGVDPVELDLGGFMESSVSERFDDGEIRVGHVHVLADDPDSNAPLEALDPVDECLPRAQIDLMVRQVDPEHLADDLVELLFVHRQWDLVDAWCINRGDDRLGGHVTQQ